MERRRFLGNLAIGVAATVIPAKIIADVIGHTETGIIKGKEFIPPGLIYVPWTINYQTKTIIYNGGWDETGIKIEDLHNYLKEEWKDDEGIMINPAVV